MKRMQPVFQWRRALPVASCAALLFAAGCGARESGERSSASPQQSGPTETLRVHLTAPVAVAAPVIEAFERESRVEVELVDNADARADVVWSANPYDLTRRAREGELAPLAIKSIADWPATWRDAEWRWCGFAAYARVAVFNTELLGASGAPSQLIDLLDPRFLNKVVMPSPRDPAMSAYLGALLHIWGEEVYRAWLDEMKQVGVRVIDNGAAVVEAVGAGEALVGLTDSIDASLGRAKGWPVDLRIIGHANSFGAAFSTADMTFDGAMVIPFAIGVRADGANPDLAKRFAEFVLSEASERLLAEGAARLMPLRPALRDAFPHQRAPSNGYTRKFEDFSAINAHIERAVDIAVEVLEE